MVPEQKSSKVTPLVVSLAGNGILGFLVFLLILTQIWMFTRVRKLENDMDYVTAVAENADQFAHSHGYSDLRLKTDITPLSEPLEKVLTLRGVQFSWRNDEFPRLNLGNDPQIGLIAQDVQKVFPELVTVGPGGYLQVDYEKLVPVLIEAIKEQQGRIDELEARTSELPALP